MSESNPKQGSHDEYAQPSYQDYYSDQQQGYNDKSKYDYQERNNESRGSYERKDNYQRSSRHDSRYSQNDRYSQESSGSRYPQNDRYSQENSSSNSGSNRNRFDTSNGIHRMEDTIYISNLPQEVTEENLAAHFGSIGIIKTDKKLRKPKIWIYMDKATNLPKGDATITYDDPPSADAAIDWFGGKEFLGNVIQVSKAERKMNVPERGGRGGGRGGSGGGGGRSYGSSGRSERPTSSSSSREGDWACEECGANNFSRRDECYTCHKPRSGGSGGGKRYEDKRGDSYRNNRSYRRDRPY